ncbi:hypothetical protein HanIR_Chr05g0230981 [Helianthus annuus]|nr:hypothetical protein HanIR_Chr05g0230981 [Helianthus annuus]
MYLQHNQHNNLTQSVSNNNQHPITMTVLTQHHPNLTNNHHDHLQQQLQPLLPTSSFYLPHTPDHQ